MSSINQNNINGEYPIAGQDNDSQGFRDNFTNIKNNLKFAKEELEDLQSKVLLKSGLSVNGGVLSNNLNYTTLEAPALKSAVEIVNSVGTIADAAITITWTDGLLHYLTLNSVDTTVTLSGWATSGLYAKMRLEINVSTAGRTLTFSTSGVTFHGLNNIVGSTGNAIVFPAVGKYLLELSTYNSGTDVTVTDVLRNVGSLREDLANGAAANLSIETTHFSTGGAETGTLAAGVEGQVKVLAMVATSGNMVITVTNAGWKTSGTGTITFDTIGDAVTLKYINSKWFCIGNNGATFA